MSQFTIIKSRETTDDLHIALWQPCWRCGNQYSKKEKTCPSCESRRRRY